MASSPEEYSRSYLLGYFLGDGHCQIVRGKYPCYSFMGNVNDLGRLESEGLNVGWVPKWAPLGRSALAFRSNFPVSIARRLGFQEINGSHHSVRIPESLDLDPVRCWRVYGIRMVV